MNNKIKKYLEGEPLFFCSQSLFGPWQTEVLKRKKRKSSCKDKKCWVALACHSMQGLQSQGRGHTAMIYTESTEWTLVVVQQLKDKTENDKLKVLQFQTNQDKLSNTASWYNQKEIVFCWVSVHANHKESKTHLFINPPSEQQPTEFFESTICPSIHNNFVRKQKRKTENKQQNPSKKRRKKTKSETVATSVTKWITIYVSNLKKSCLEIWHESRRKENLFLVPETNPLANTPMKQFLGNRISVRKRNFHAIKKDEVGKINNLLECRFDEKLIELSKETIPLLEIRSLRDNPIRFVRCSHDEFMKQKKQKGNQYLEYGKSKYVFAFSSAKNIEINGCVMSMWVYNKAEPCFSFKDLETTQSAVGGGFGDRGTMQCTGVNVYMGSRLSKRPRPSPLMHSKDKIYWHDFWRKHYQCLEQLAPIRKKLCKAVRQVAKVAKDINSEYHNFIGRHTCSFRSIMTLGTSERTLRFINQQGKVSWERKKATGVVDSIGFSSTIHRDECDLITEDQFDELMKNNGTREKYCHHWEMIRNNITEGSFGLPTTCGHQVIFGSEKQGKVTASFGMLDFALPLDKPGVVHHFLGWSFSHMTLVPIQQQNGVVYTNNSTFKEKNWDGAAIVLAWGSTGGSKEAKLHLDEHSRIQSRSSENHP